MSFLKNEQSLFVNSFNWECDPDKAVSDTACLLGHPPILHFAAVSGTSRTDNLFSFTR